MVLSDKIIEIDSQNWQESDLAIYYFKENTKEWIKIGGKAENGIISVKVNYLHTTYAIFGSKPPEFIKIFGDLKIWPNPFTPDRGGETYGNVKISWIFKSSVNQFTFKVYDLIGRVVYEYKYENGPYYQGEIYWDGKDDSNNKYPIKSGVYIFQIEVGNEYYRGKVLILK